jgi:hypothetical protein
VYIYAAKVVFKDLNNFHLVEIPLKGDSYSELKNGQSVFSSIKFDSTSYNNDVYLKKIKFCIFNAIFRE